MSTRNEDKLVVDNVGVYIGNEKGDGRVDG